MLLSMIRAQALWSRVVAGIDVVALVGCVVAPGAHFVGQARLFIRAAEQSRAVAPL